jgi:hypothetical protein
MRRPAAGRHSLRMTPDCTIIARSPAELIAVVPYLLGFHPAQSIVVIGLTGRLVTFGARYDLPPPGGDDATADMAAVIASQPARSVVLVGYGPAASVTPAILRLSRALEQAEVPLCDSIRVTEGRWWSYFCADPQCCPVDGRSCPPPGNPIAAEAVFQGKVALPNRQALVAQVAAVTGDARNAMVAATARAVARLRIQPATKPPHIELPGGPVVDLQFAGGRSAEGQAFVDVAGRRVPRAGRAAVRSAERRHRVGKSLSDDEVALLGVLLADDTVLDYALNRCDDLEWRISLWTDVLRRVEPAYVGAPACLLAFAAWQAGQGALARVAVDRALIEGSEHPTAALLDGLISAGISPQAVAALRPPFAALAPAGSVGPAVAVGPAGTGRPAGTAGSGGLLGTGSAAARSWPGRSRPPRRAS